MQFVPKLLIFTCNKDPQAWYDWNNCAHPMQALVRRITNQWHYVKQVQPEWGLEHPNADANGQPFFFAYALRELGEEEFHPARRCMQHLKDFPNGQSLFGFTEDPDLHDNVEDVDPDTVFP